MALRHMKCGVDHAERRQNMPLEEHTQSLPRQHLDEAPDDIGRATVFPPRSRLMKQRHLAEGSDLIGAALRAAVQLRTHVHFLYRPGAAKLIGKTRGMTQKILDGDGALERHPLELPTSLHGDFKVREIGKVFGDGIVQQEPPFFPQHHRRHRSDGLGHGIDTEDCVLRHRRAAGGIALTKTFEEPKPAAPGDEYDGAGHTPAFDLGTHHRTQASEANGREADFFGRGERQRKRCHGVDRACACRSSKPDAWLR